MGLDLCVVGEDDCHVCEGVPDGGRLPVEVGDEVRETRGVSSLVSTHCWMDILQMLQKHICGEDLSNPVIPVI